MIHVHVVEKKVEPKKAEKKPEENEAEAAMTKAKNPLDLLPPSPFNFFDFKTLIVNAKDKKEAIDFLFKNFDKSTVPLNLSFLPLNFTFNLN